MLSPTKGGVIVPTRPFLNLTEEGVTKLLEEYGRTQLPSSISLGGPNGRTVRV